jgi:ubiquinol-cytochrome c reductase iron-sulfur subunit
MTEHPPDGSDPETDVGATVGTGGGSERGRAAGGGPVPRLRGAEVWIAVAFVAAVFGGFGLAACYAAGGQPQVEGVLLFVTLGGIGFGIAAWGKYLFPQGPYEQPREPMTSTPEERALLARSIERGSDDFSRRRFLRRLMTAAGAALGVALVFPIRSLGPNPDDQLEHTGWSNGKRVVDTGGRPLTTAALAVGGVTTVFPEGFVGDATSQTLLIHAADNPVVTAPGRETWSPDGYLAYSKVCTHAGCPVGLYQQRTNQLVCPCHQSLFNVLEGARVVFGPAPRALPQLALAVDAQGFLIAQHDFDEAVGPSFWDR